MATEVSVYRVLVTREGQAWLADVPDLAGTHTWARTLPRLDRDVREAIALAEDLPEGAEASLELVFDYRTGDPDLDIGTAEVRGARVQLAQHEAQVTTRTADLIRILTDKGYSVRDTARLLGIAPQRVSQIAPRRSTRAS